MINEKEKNLLEYIVREISEKGYQPSIREMMKVINVKSLRGVTYHLDELQRKGYIQKERLSRSITILERSFFELKDIFPPKNEDQIKIPFLGRIAAGNPIVAIENYTETLSVPRSIAKNHMEYFALEVTGDSMIGDHILEGDIVIIKKQNSARNGQIVAAVIEDSVTLKHFYIENNRCVLKASNIKYRPIIPEGNFLINGVMVGLIRKYCNN